MATSSGASDDTRRIPINGSVYNNSGGEVAFVFPVRRIAIGLMSAAVIFATCAIGLGASGDFDGNGYVGPVDHLYFEVCLGLSGPGIDPRFTECRDIFDADGDRDVDLADVAVFQRARGHLPIPLRDTLGNVLLSGSTTPYSGQRTCATGGCHDLAVITNGFKFQQGRTDTQGNIIVRDDFFNDGRWWQRSAGRYGICSTGGGLRPLAAKESSDESQIDMTTFEWVAGCSGCHPGGGPGEFDRDGLRLWDPGTGKFGYELLGKSSTDVRLDGDYSFMDAAGTLTLAPWNVTGISEADCLFCHTPDPAWNNGQNINRRTWRSATLAAGRTGLVDDAGQPVPAFAAVGAANQGWFSSLPIVGGVATKLQLDYSVGVDRGTLTVGDAGVLQLLPQSVDFPPRDNACWVCHGPVGWTRLRGAIWFDPRDFHYAKLNKLLDDDPQNDIPPERSTTCNFCHRGGLDHDFAKGNSFAQHFRDEHDWLNLRSCRSCHLEDSPTRHPDAPPVPGNLPIHVAMWEQPDILSCQACHIPRPWADLAATSAFGDRSVTGNSISYMANEFYSADPLDPSNPDKSAWYPAFYRKKDSDGVVRLFPALPAALNIYWGDWDQRGTPDDLSDDLIAPVISWRFKQITHGQPLPGITDDNGDGKLEINRPEEMLIYMNALKGNDSYGRQIAARPVFVKGRRVWYEDPLAPSGVNSFDPEAVGIDTDWQGVLWGLNHNPFRAAEGWGHAREAEQGCIDCHRPGTLDSPVFDRKILADPFGADGQPVYTTVRAMTGLNPP